ncbi:MAG: DUF1206 domain-containing protein [Pelagerythrobacter marensis]|nr:MAG: DUF1206 domain-containing protein [Pelagerythrobacter marensis]
MVDKSEKFSWLVRLGYAARGLVYTLLGYLALTTASAASAGQSAAFDFIQNVPFGRPILYATALGLLAYGVYRLLDALSNIERHEQDAEGLAARLGAAASGVAHFVLAWTAWQFANGTVQRAAGDTGGAEAASTLLDWDMGALLLGIVGLGLFAAAAKQAYDAVMAGFMKHISPSAPSLIEPLGRAGHAARAVVFAVIGWSVVKSAWFVKAEGVRGLGGAIAALREMGWLYTLVAVGLILFGIFSLISARYRTIPDVSRADIAPRV